MNDVSEAFADDQAIEQFVEENKPTEQETDDQAAMFGWGKWVNPVELRRPKPPKRKAENYLSMENPHVIFNIPEKDEIQKHLVSFVPYKFSDKKQFEDYINQPIGREWNTAYKFRAKVEPRIQTNPGIAISPLDSRTISNPETEKLKKLASGLPLKIREALLSKIL
uniref:U3 small nucleolar RNA-associated protein 14 homolog A (Trinotate prediction) n=1 Tax=Myxobolus squamalis TaxID=59785 RepID=A0A6B2G3E6_MYXSQ